MNKCVLIGNLTKDPDLRTLPNTGVSVCNFTVAVSRRFKNQNGEREADFIPVVVWRTQAEHCAKYLRKGSQVAVAGSIQTRSYEVEGNRRYITEVVADEVKFLNRVNGSGESDGGYTPSAEPSGFGKSMQEIDEDLPF
ncbi:MAG: single-stranded DNA-binding protein [Eubacteriales bacterium]|nr:single-stranded DNA-binding protein [Eubacteriales bacterium]